MAYPPATFAADHQDGVGEIIEAAHVNDLETAANDIVAELGANPSGSGFSTVQARLEALEVLTANTQTDNYTLVASDTGKVVEVNAATTKTVTVPPNSSVAFATGTVIEVYRYGAGAVNIAAGSGVTIRSRGGLLGIGNQYGAVTLRKRATDEWSLIGDLA